MKSKDTLKVEKASVVRIARFPSSSFGQKGDSVTANGQMGETVYKVTSQFLLVVRNSKYPKTRGIVGEDSANR